MKSCGSFVYENDVLSYILISYGRILYKDGRFSREYNLTDHLGNVRVVFHSIDGVAVAKQEMHYYAFGLQQSGVGFDNSTNEFFYNGKELQEEAGINYLNYGWRQLDPQLGIWHSVDKLAEMYPSESPYSYAGNNPINQIDIAGLQKYSMFDPIIYSTFGKESYKRGGGIGPGTTIDRIVDEYDALAENDAIPDGMSVSDFIDVKTSKTYYVYDNTTNTLYLNENLLSGYCTTDVNGNLYKLELNNVGTYLFKGSVKVGTFDGLLKRIGAGLLDYGEDGDYAFGDDSFKLKGGIIGTTSYPCAGNESNLNFKSINPDSEPVNYDLLMSAVSGMLSAGLPKASSFSNGISIANNFFGPLNKLVSFGNALGDFGDAIIPDPQKKYTNAADGYNRGAYTENISNDTVYRAYYDGFLDTLQIHKDGFYYDSNSPYYP